MSLHPVENWIECAGVLVLLFFTASQLHIKQAIKFKKSVGIASRETEPETATEQSVSLATRLLLLCSDTLQSVFTLKYRHRRPRTAL